MKKIEYERELNFCLTLEEVEALKSGEKLERYFPAEEKGLWTRMKFSEETSLNGRLLSWEPEDVAFDLRNSSEIKLSGEALRHLEDPQSNYKFNFQTPEKNISFYSAKSSYLMVR